MSKEIEILEKQLAFWKHHAASLAKALDDAEQVANHYAKMLDETEEELNAERTKNEAQGYRKQSEGEWIDKPTGAYSRMQSWCSACGKHSGIGGIESNRHKPFCPNCGAKMKGGAE